MEIEKTQESGEKKEWQSSGKAKKTKASNGTVKNKHKDGGNKPPSDESDIPKGQHDKSNVKKKSLSASKEKKRQDEGTSEMHSYGVVEVAGEGQPQEQDASVAGERLQNGRGGADEKRDATNREQNCNKEGDSSSVVYVPYQPWKKPGQGRTPQVEESEDEVSDSDAAAYAKLENSKGEIFTKCLVNQPPAVKSEVESGVHQELRERKLQRENAEHENAERERAQAWKREHEELQKARQREQCEQKERKLMQRNKKEEEYQRAREEQQQIKVTMLPPALPPNSPLPLAQRRNALPFGQHHPPAEGSQHSHSGVNEYMLEEQQELMQQWEDRQRRINEWKTADNVGPSLGSHPPSHIGTTSLAPSLISDMSLGASATDYNLSVLKYRGVDKNGYPRLSKAWMKRYRSSQLQR